MRPKYFTDQKIHDRDCAFVRAPGSPHVGVCDCWVLRAAREQGTAHPVPTGWRKSRSYGEN